MRRILPQVPVERRRRVDRRGSRWRCRQTMRDRTEPWQFACLPECEPSTLPALPAEVARCCESASVLSALAVERYRTVYDARCGRERSFRSSDIGAIDVPSGRLLVVAGSAPLKRRPTVLAVESGMWRVHVWTAANGSHEGRCAEAERVRARAVVLRRGGQSSGAWALVGRSNSRSALGPWLPRSHKLGQHILIGDHALEQRFQQALSAEADDVEVVEERLDSLSRKRRTAIAHGFGDSDPRLVNAFSDSCGPVVYARVSRPEEAQCVIVILYELGGSLQSQ
jgi:hypothetical protein